jgi:hypothetical protein
MKRLCFSCAKREESDLAFSYSDCRTESGKDVLTAFPVALLMADKAAKSLFPNVDEMNSAIPWLAANGARSACFFSLPRVMIRVATGAASVLISTSSSLQRS